MALKRGFCTNCQGEERLRIFEVNKGAENCHCPHCGRLMQPKEAIQNYHNLISNHLKRASRYLFESTEYLLAYQEFAYIIDLDETVKVAYFGRLLALVYLSTLRTSKINFAFLMHRQQAPRLFHYQETASEYYNFLLLLLDALDTYVNRMKKRLTSRGVFYDTDCVSLFLTRIDEIRSYKDFIASEADYFIENNKGQFHEVIERVKASEEEYQKTIQESFQTANGFSYTLIGYGDNSLPTINTNSSVDPSKTHHVKEINLNPKDNKKSPIRDDIYLNNLPLSKLVTISIPLAIVLLALGIASIIVGIFVPPIAVKIIFFILAALLASSSLMLFILHFSFKNRLRRTYYNGTNPFIFK